MSDNNKRNEERGILGTIFFGIFEVLGEVIGDILEIIVDCLGD